MSQKHIVLVEDDEKLSKLIQAYLTKNGFLVDVVDNGIDAISKIIKVKPDLAILDVMLPGKDGFEVCREVKPQYQGCVLFLTAKASDFDQVLGLELGADDYVIKPVEPRVLLARIQALLRRSTSTQPDDDSHIKFGRLEINKKARVVTLNEQEVVLTSHEFDMLLLLVKHAGDILSRDYLSKQLIGREYDGTDRSLDVRVSKLRKKLGDSAESPFRIKTIWGQGYMFVPDAWS